MFGNLRRADHDGVKVSRWGDPWKVARANDQGGRDGVKRRHSRSRLPIGGRLVLTGAVLLAAVLAMAPAASAATSNWQLVNGTVKPPTATSLATFNFSVQDKAHLLETSSCLAPPPALPTSSCGASKLGSNDYGTTMSASYSVQGVNGTFTYGGEPSCGGATANVRLYFESITPGSKFAYTNYWWSDTAVAALANTTAPVPLTALVADTAGWSDWNGQTSASESAAFQVAAGKVTAIGLSFGGGCFFENGVGTSDGSGSFTLNTFTVS
jgi:hypothetical protein